MSSYLQTAKENDMLARLHQFAAYDTTVEGYHDQIQDIFRCSDSGST